MTDANVNHEKPTAAETTTEKSLPDLDEPFKNVQPADAAPPASAAPVAKGGPKETLQMRMERQAEASNMVTALDRLGEAEDYVDCPHCEQRAKTKIYQHDSSQTSMAALLCCLCCGVITVCIPSLCHWCADVEHRCTKCGKTVAYKPHDGPTQPRLPQEEPRKISKYAPMPQKQKDGLEVPAAAPPYEAEKPLPPVGGTEELQSTQLGAQEQTQEQGVPTKA